MVSNKSADRLINTVRLIGTIICPFTKVSRGKFTVYTTRIEVKGGTKQNIPLTFYAKQNYQIFDYRKDLTGKQVIVDAYVQGNEFIKQDGTSVDYIYIVAREIVVLSDRDKGVNVEEDIYAKGVVINDDELPF